MGSKEKEKEKDGSGVFAGVVVGAVVLVTVGGPIFAELGWPHFHGATPAQLMDEPLSRSPKQLASDLPATKLSTSTVTVQFKKGTAGEFEKAEYTWDDARSDAPHAMRLRVPYHEKAPDLSNKLARHLHALDGGKHHWGAVTVRARDDGDVSFDVDRAIDGKPNPLFDRQIEAAKEVILNAAFDLPVRLSDREIADVLGAGYAPGDVAKFDPTTTVEQAGDALRKAMPATLGTGDSFEVPLDHPLVKKVRFGWENRPHGRLSTIYFTPTARYPGSHDALEACVEKKLGPPGVNVTDYARGKKDYVFTIGPLSLRIEGDTMHVRVSPPVDAASFSSLFTALGACRDSGESGGGTQ